MNFLAKSNSQVYEGDQDPAFIPIRCHCSLQKVVSTSGNVIQTLRLISTNAATVELSRMLNDIFVSKNISVWVNTLKSVEETRIYLSFVSSTDQDFSNIWKLFESLLPAVMKDKNAHIDRNSKYLDTQVEKALQKKDVAHLGSIGILDHGAGLVTQNMTFVQELVSCRYGQLAPLEVDTIDYPALICAKFRVIFHSNHFEISAAKAVDNKVFGGIMIIKRYSGFIDQLSKELEALTFSLDICEILIPLSSKERDSEIKKTSSIVEVVSGAKDSEMSRLLGAPKNSVCNKQAIITVVSKSIQELEDSIWHLSRVLDQFGVVSYRADIRMRECFWSRIPSNVGMISFKRQCDGDSLVQFLL